MAREDWKWSARLLRSRILHQFADFIGLVDDMLLAPFQRWRRDASARGANTVCRAFTETLRAALCSKVN
jgi:hypothetical protein